ncbi:MAG: glutamate-cysteine ligase family protein [Candidatus Undinarchaeales archaeon]|jgi:hypothetical protein|nr:glutamate-cysteine ligase family protein [Candidatus Undinarchaeales archaeon]MDP7491555.1 glutamate-cysteine ligase family protein [Candidatus Undinarchaeales archaeon]
MEIVNEGHSVGLEKEFYIVNHGSNGNLHLGAEMGIASGIGNRMREELGAYDDEVGPKAYLDASGPMEVVTRPCSDLHQLTNDITTAYDIAQEVVEAHGKYALGMGTRPGAPDDKAGLHVHVGYGDEAEAEYVFTVLKHHVPEIMALSANSPNKDGTIKDMRAANRSYGQRYSPFSTTSNESVIKKRDNTLEVRCMDTQGTAEEDAAIAAYILGIAEKAKIDYANGEGVSDRFGDEIKNHEQAIKDGMAATFTYGDETRSVQEVAQDTFVAILPYLRQYDCPDEVVGILADKIVRGRSGADDILDIYAEHRSHGFMQTLASPFTFWSRRKALYNDLAHQREWKAQERERADSGGA